MGTDRLATLAPAVAVAALLSRAAPALARGGGGEHWGGGGGSGGGGGDVDIGPIVELLVWLLLRHPEVGVPLVALAILAAVAWAWWEGTLGTRRAVRRRSWGGMGGAPSPDRERGLARLREADPAFDEGRFAGRATRAFLEVQEGWAAERLDGARRLLSDGLHARFRVQLDLIRLSGKRDAVAGMRVLGARILAVDAGDRFDAVHLRIDAVARDTDVPAGTPEAEVRRRALAAPEERFAEVWSFFRRKGATTRPGHDVVEGNCPNCGASVESGGTVRCGHCRALVNSGVHDWVVGEITQVDAWHPHPSARVPGEAEIAARDPAYGRQAVEDRAALLFWKWMEARVTGRAGAVAKVALPEVRAAAEGEAVELRGRGEAFLARDLVVGAVELAAAHPDPGGRDRLHVRVRWSGRTATASPGTDLSRVAPWPRTSYLVLGREAGVVTEPEAGLSSAHCRGCGAPLGDGDQPSCEYCGAELAAGDQDWVLEAVLSPEQAAAAGRSQEPRGRERGAEDDDGPLPEWLRPDLGHPDDRLALLAAACRLARSDGLVDGGERRLLRSMARRWGIPRRQVDAWIRGPIPDATFRAAPGSEEARASLRALHEAALVDGRVDHREAAFLDFSARRLGLPEGAWRGSAGSRG
ncbi:TIM44-like domain-containing protein [Myxococcota bacterium]|nr:TIM44-like domain-containing protein [Myxococcota bacterium]